MAYTLLITGGAGFIGSNFAHYIAEANPTWDIHVLDALTYAGNLDNLTGVSYHFHHACITDTTALTTLFSDYHVDAIVHFAAESHVDRSISDSSPFIKTNIQGTQCLLDCALRYNVSQFIHISTDEVYGSTETGLFSETSPLNPSSPYAASKASSDLLALSYFKTHNLPVCVTRCSNNYGPRQFPEKLIPLMINRAVNNQPLPVYGTGKNIRDWLHVSDHCRAIGAVMKQGKPGEIYNIGGNNEQTNLDIIYRLLDYLDKPRTAVQFITDRLGHDWRYAVCYDKLAALCNWSPVVDFESGLRDTIAYYTA